MSNLKLSRPGMPFHWYILVISINFRVHFARFVQLGSRYLGLLRQILGHFVSFWFILLKFARLQDFGWNFLTTLENSFTNLWNFLKSLGNFLKPLGNFSTLLGNFVTTLGNLFTTLGNFLTLLGNF